MFTSISGLGKGMLTAARCLLTLALVPALVVAQTPATNCYMYLGWNSLRCATCTVDKDGKLQLLAEPTIQGVSSASMYAGLHEGDTLVQVNGHFITTSEAWSFLSNPKTSGAVRLTVRRNGQPVTVTVPGYPLCKPVGADSATALMAAVAAMVGAPGDSTRVATSAAAARRGGGRGGRGGFGGIIPIQKGAARAALESDSSSFHTDSLGRINGWTTLMSPRSGTNGVYFADSVHIATPARRLGMGLECNGCMGHMEGDSVQTMVYTFRSHPVVNYLVPGGTAERAGVRLGDTIMAVNGADIMTPTGGRAFSITRPGQMLSLSMAHGTEGRTLRLAVLSDSPSTLVGSYRSTPFNAVVATKVHEFSVGNVHVAVDGGIKKIDMDSKTSELVITFDDGHTVRMTVMAPGVVAQPAAASKPPRS